MEGWKEYPHNISYQISNHGNIRIITKKEVSFIPCKFTHTGKYYSLFGGGISKCVHMMVAETFLERPERTDNVRHKNGNTHDNRVENLEWYTIQRKGGRPKKTDGNGNTLPSVTTDWQEKLDKIPFPDEQESVYNPVVKRINKYVIMNVPFTSQYMVLFIENKLSEHIGTYESYEEANESIQ